MNLPNIAKGMAFAVLLAGSAAASAATVTFSNFQDGNNDPALFDISANVISGNTLTVGLNNFTADGSSIVTQAANDTLAFTITAPAGYWITSVSYTEEGDGETTNGIATASGALVADGIPANFLTQVFGPQTSSAWSITPTPIAIDNKTEIAVSINNNLFAIALGGGETATISKTFAELEVGLTAIPLPPAILMLGSALVGLGTVGMRRRQTAA